MDLVGGKRLDQNFLADLPVAPGMQIGLYSDAGTARECGHGHRPTQPSCRSHLIPSGCSAQTATFPAHARYQSLIDSARTSGQQTSAILYLTGRREDSVNATAIPLKNDTGNVLAVLTGGDFAQRHG